MFKHTTAQEWSNEEICTIDNVIERLQMCIKKMRLKEENKNKPWIDEPIYKHEY